MPALAPVAGRATPELAQSIRERAKAGEAAERAPRVVLGPAGETKAGRRCSSATATAGGTSSPRFRHAAGREGGRGVGRLPGAAAAAASDLRDQPPRAAGSRRRSRRAAAGLHSVANADSIPNLQLPRELRPKSFRLGRLKELPVVQTWRRGGKEEVVLVAFPRTAAAGDLHDHLPRATDS